jgi:hypothetical protein
VRERKKERKKERKEERKKEFFSNDLLLPKRNALKVKE